MKTQLMLRTLAVTLSLGAFAEVPALHSNSDPQS